MFTTCTVDEPFFEPLDVLPPELLSLPHAASRALAPLTAATPPAALPMNARRVDGANGSRGSFIAPPFLPHRVGPCFVPAPLPSSARPRAADRRVVPRNEEPLKRDDRQVEEEAEQRQHQDHREQRLGLEVVQARDDPVPESL